MTKNILLVEYDETTILTIKELFHPPFFEVAVASDGDAAKQLLKSRSFDLMITAAMLPRFHGFNLALNVSQEHPGIKIIIISAIYKGLEYRHQALTQYRANDFFEKPLDKDKFKKRVLELLNVPEAALAAAAQAATTQVPVFDTAKIPAPKFDDDDESKLSSADIFGDIIQKIEKVPEFEIDLGDGSRGAARKPAAAPTAPPRPGAKPDPGQTVMRGSAPAAPRKPEPVIDFDSLKAVKKPAAAPAPAPPVSPGIEASLDVLRQQQPKREAPKDQMRKIEDDIARKFEDTLSGLGLHVKSSPAPAPPAKPAAPPPPPRVVVPEARPAAPPPSPVVMPEVKAVPRPMPAAPPPAAQDDSLRDALKDEVIDLGEAALIREPEPVAKPPEPRPAPPPPRPAEEVAAPREAKPEKKAAAEENPNEVGDYALLGLIARGGMAEIYKAKKKGVKGFEKVIAIKKILSGYGEDDKYIEMLVDEAKIAAELSHPNIVQIYDLGRKDNYYFIAMEYVLGKDLREIQTRLRERDMWFPEEIAVTLTIKILEALNYAHKAKDSRGRSLDIVHRDVSPPNILISYNGDVKLTDFGVSKASIKIHQTLSGALKGKLLYMSPEQACGDSTIDYRSDLYSAGVVLFELLTGKKLFLDTSEMLVLKKVQNGEIIDPREIKPDIDPALEKILLTSLNKECAKRYQSAAAMITDLEAYLHRKYDRAPGPVHIGHFLYSLFEADIQREGVKVDLKPLPYIPKVRETARPQPAPERPKPVVVPPPPAPEPAAPPPPAPPPVPEGLLSISFDEEKAPPTAKRAAREEPAFRPESMFKEVDKPRKRSPLVALAVIVLVGAIGAGVYFFVLRKPAPVPSPSAQPPAAQEVKAAAAATPGAAAAGQAPGSAAQAADMQKIDEQLAATQKLIDEATQKQEEELKKIQAEEERKKQLDEQRRKKVEADRQRKEEEDRLRQEEAARLLREEEERKKQEEAARLQKEEEDRRKAEELRRAEQNRVREGDIVPLNQVDAQPVAVSTPSPTLPSSIRATMPDSVTVMFSALIDQNGNVETVRLLQRTNNAQLNTILTDLVKTWKYQPATKNSVRVKVWKTIPMTIKK